MPVLLVVHVADIIALFAQVSRPRSLLLLDQGGAVAYDNSSVDELQVVELWHSGDWGLNAIDDRA